MNGSFPRTGLFTAVALAACSSATQAPVATGVEPGIGSQATLTPAAQAKADGGRPRYTAADVHFISGMIGHHAQAVVMAGWAPSHGASQAIRALCERIVVGQRDEIGFMRTWLRDRQEKVPDEGAVHHMVTGTEPAMLMPGMLTAGQMAELEGARGSDFDRLFLRFMIQHHQGAIDMVEQLLGAPGAAQDDNVWKFASDVHVDQITEIDFMSKMLAALAP